MTAAEVMTKYRITRQTLCRWKRDGKIEYTTTPSGRFIYGLNESYEKAGEEQMQSIIIYAKVSVSRQKEKLEKMKELGFVIEEIHLQV